MGIATHLGVLLDRPTLGCAKSILTGHAEEPGPNPGDRSPLLAPDGELLGLCRQNPAGRQPVYVSAGHRMRHETAVELVLRCARGYRLPRAHAPGGQARGNRNGVRGVAGGSKTPAGESDVLQLPPRATVMHPQASGRGAFMRNG